MDGRPRNGLTGYILRIWVLRYLSSVVKSPKFPARPGPAAPRARPMAARSCCDFYCNGGVKGFRKKGAFYPRPGRRPGCGCRDDPEGHRADLEITGTWILGRPFRAQGCALARNPGLRPGLGCCRAFGPCIMGQPTSAASFDRLCGSIGDAL